MIINCLEVEIFKDHGGDCSNGGISSRFHSILVPCPFGPVSFDSEKELPLNFCTFETRDVFEGILYTDIVPATVNEYGGIWPRPGWWMFGGTIAYTSDSRFSSMAGLYPLKIRDRQERNRRKKA